MTTQRLLLCTGLALTLFAGSAGAHVSGYVFCDANHNGQLDSGEGIPGVTVLLCDGNPAVTDANGFYYFSSPPPYLPCDVSVVVASVPGTCNIQECATTVTLTHDGPPPNVYPFYDNINFCFTPPGPPPPCPCPTSIGPVNFGTLANGLVIGLANTKINNSLVTINGNEYVSQGGSLVNMAPSTIKGNVYEFAAQQYSGPGKLYGSLIINPALLTQVDNDALAVASAAATLTPTATLGTVSSPTTLVGNGGLNVILINGDVKNSLILAGTSADVFIVNVTGTLSLGGSAVLGVSGGVTSGNVLYNFLGANGTISTHVGNVVNGTLLGLNYSFSLDGAFSGRIIGGGSSITLKSGTLVTPPVCPSCP